MRSESEFQRVKALLDEGLSDCAAARNVGVPRSTVRHWRSRPSPPGAAARRAMLEWSAEPADAYCYVLGLYLGDGHLSNTGGASGTLTVALDARHTGVVDEAAAISHRDSVALLDRLVGPKR